VEGLTIAVLGSGPAACEIARQRAQAGHVVRLYAPHADALTDAAARIRDSVDALLAAGDVTAADRQRTLDGIVWTTDLEEALTGAGVVVDARR
jgi:3-hydroxyacyl-CoA dehydrogenase